MAETAGTARTQASRSSNLRPKLLIFFGVVTLCLLRLATVAGGAAADHRTKATATASATLSRSDRSDSAARASRIEQRVSAGGRLVDGADLPWVLFAGAAGLGTVALGVGDLRLQCRPA